MFEDCFLLKFLNYKILRAQGKDVLKQDLRIKHTEGFLILLTSVSSTHAAVISSQELIPYYCHLLGELEDRTPRVYLCLGHPFACCDTWHLS